MKKSRIFMAAGTLALAFAAIFATKANKRFAAVKTACMSGNTSYLIYFEGTTNYLETSSTLLNNQQLNMRILTSTGTLITPVADPLITASSHTDRVYFN